MRGKNRRRVIWPGEDFFTIGRVKLIEIHARHVHEKMQQLLSDVSNILTKVQMHMMDTWRTIKQKPLAL